MSHRAGYPAPDSCRLLWLPPASLSHFPTTPATHNNFSFNFSILSVIYTCHAMASEALSRSPMPRFPFGPLRFACFLPFGFFFICQLVGRSPLFLLLPSLLIIPCVFRGVPDPSRRLALVNQIKQHGSQQLLKSFTLAAQRCLNCGSMLITK